MGQLDLQEEEISTRERWLVTADMRFPLIDK